MTRLPAPSIGGGAVTFDELLEQPEDAQKLPFQDIIFTLGGHQARDFLVGVQVEREAFQRDVARVRKRLRDQQTGVVNPRGKFIQYWDMVTALALFYTLFVTPFEVGLDLPTRLDGLFITNQVVTVVFISDILIQFNLPFPEPTQGDGAYERRHSKIAYRYLLSWFTLDLVTVIPFDILVLLGTLSGPVKGTKLIRIMRLLKVLKVLRSSAIIERWKSSFAVSTSTLQMTAYAFGAIVVLHWLSCGWCLLATLADSQRGGPGSEARSVLAAAVLDRIDTLTAGGAECNACFDDDETTVALCTSPCLTACERETLAQLEGVSTQFVENNESWLCRSVEYGHLSPLTLINGAAAADVYISALLVSMFLMVGGVATLLPTNTSEYMFFFIAVLLGTILFAAVQGIVCGVVTNGNPDETAWKQNYDALNFMMDDSKNLTQEEKVRVRTFFRKSRTLFKRRSYVSLIDECLSPELKDDVRFLISQEIFRSVWYLVGLDREFLEDLSHFIERLAYAPKEEISAKHHLNVMMVGMATRGPKVLNTGTSFGDIILASVPLRDTTPARTLIYTETAQLHRDHLLETIKDYPEVAPLIRQASVKLAVNRAMLIISLHVQVRAGNIEHAISKRLAKASKDTTDAKDAMPTPAPLPVPAGAAPPASRGPGSPTREKAKAELPADEALKESFHKLLGEEWKELEYDSEGGAPVRVQQKASVLGLEADEKLRRLAEADEMDEKTEMLAKIMLETKHQVALLSKMVSTLMPEGADLLASPVPSAPPQTPGSANSLAAAFQPLLAA